MSTTLLKTIADFDTQLATASAIGDTTATLVSATDDDGVALPTGLYGLTIDAGNSSKEYIICTLTSTALTGILNISRQGTTSSGFARSHRRGAKVTLTDWAILKRILNNIDGTTGFDSASPLSYDGNPTFTADGQIITKKYADDLAIAGSPDASTTVKGISKLSSAPASPTNPIAVGDNDTRVPTQDENNAMVGNNTDIAVGTGNKMVTQTGLQKQAENYAASATGNDTYVITLSPAPTSYVNGMTIRFKPDTANTGAATLNVNSLGALSIVTGLSTPLATGDIVANQVVEVTYNSTGTVWQLKNPASAVIVAPVIPASYQQVAVQDSTTITYATGQFGNSSTDGSVMIVGTTVSAGGSIVLWRFVRDSVTLQYIMTHETSWAGTSWGSNTQSVVIAGNYVYTTANDNGTKVIWRHDLADLTNKTAITISGSNWSVGSTAFSDGTSIYVYTSVSATNTTFKKYTISGTTATYDSDITYNASTSGTSDIYGSVSDGTNVFIHNRVDGITKKYALAGGAATATVTRIIYPAAYPNYSQPRLIIPKTGALAFIFGHTVESNTAVEGSITEVLPFAQPS